MALAGATGAFAQSDDIAQMKAQLAAQQQQIEELRKALANLEAPPQKLAQNGVWREMISAPDDGARRTLCAPQFSLPKAAKLGEVASITGMALPPPVTAALPVAMPVPAAASSQLSENADDTPSPLSLKIGDSYLTPVGFMDFTFVGRSTALGSGIGSNFGAIPFGNMPQGHLSESSFSTQNSRIGARFDTKVLGAQVLAYWESDFLGAAPTNLVVGSNSNTLRMRLFWIQVMKNRWEILGGQSWTLLTPSRNGISPLPGDIFYSNDTDTNYQMGLTWARQSGFRVVWHATDKIAWAFALENPQQYGGGFSGGGTITLPSNLTGPYTNLLNTGGTNTSVPNLAPDFISKIAFDPQVGGHHIHFEIAGLLSSYKLYNSLTSQSFTREGAGAAVNSNIALTKSLSAVENFYYSNGGARYIFGQGPDLIVNGNGSIGLVRAGSTVDGLELQATKNLLFYGYYGGGYFGKAVATDSTNGKPVGYGYAGSSSGNNRTIQELSFGLQNTFWKDPKWGQLRLDLQYAYVFRNPWYAALNASNQATENMVFVNLRYALPGAAPKLK
ncbi:MAG: hypothetical protein ABI165_12850 [Bryobacteraceae bacterium]